jgi:hypothetical protein
VFFVLLVTLLLRFSIQFLLLLSFVRLQSSIESKRGSCPTSSRKGSLTSFTGECRSGS